jgi:hypothetical protein
MTNNQKIATWLVTGDALYTRQFGTSEDFWLCQQTEGTPGGTQDSFIVREPHMITGLNISLEAGQVAATIAAATKKHIYPGETLDTTTRTVHGLGKGFAVNFSTPDGYAKATGAEPEFLKAQTTPSRATAGNTPATNPQGWFKTNLKWIIGGVVVVVIGLVSYFGFKKK